jgi:hypothetical protein
LAQVSQTWFAERNFARRERSQFHFHATDQELTAVLKKMMIQEEIREDPPISVGATMACRVRCATNRDDSGVWLDIRRAVGSEFVVHEASKIAFSSSKSAEVTGLKGLRNRHDETRKWLRRLERVPDIEKRMYGRVWLSW